jgi:hypothetical protein
MVDDRAWLLVEITNSGLSTAQGTDDTSQIISVMDRLVKAIQEADGPLLARPLR